MNRSSDVPGITREQLQNEVAIVEKILLLASDASTLRQAHEVAMDFIFMEPEPSDTFSSIDINEYTLYLLDMQRELDLGDQKKADDSRYNADCSLPEIEADLAKAKQKLLELTN